MMALDKAQDYLARKRVHEVKDWGSLLLDDEGKALQAEMEERQTASRHPLKPWQRLLTKMLGTTAATYKVNAHCFCRKD